MTNTTPTMTHPTVQDLLAPAPDEPLTESGALGWLPHTCFRTGPPHRTGLELEQILVPTSPLAEARAPDRRRMAEALHDLPLASRITVEPGGQLELSTPAAGDVRQAVEVLRTDLDRIRDVAARHGLRPAGLGLDPVRPPRRVLDSPRYAAMEAYFDRGGRAGRLMMCSTASVQVCVEAATTGTAADDGRLTERWQVLHDAGPALVAAFANSPLYRGRPTGWMSTRRAVWAALDPDRTAEPRPRTGESLTQAWARWALDVPLLLVRRTGADWTAPAGVTFRDWIRAGRRAVPDRPGPSWDDLCYHLTTLFPPVRARGHLEIRYLDTPPDDWWAVSAAVLAALVDRPATADAARDACAATRGRWTDAARSGVRDPDLARAAVRVLTVAAAAMRSELTTIGLATVIETYLERWTLRGRCPADDLLDVVAPARGATR